MPCPEISSLGASVSSSSGGAQMENKLEKTDQTAQVETTSHQKNSSRRCSSDGALKALQGAICAGPARVHSFSHADAQTAALQERIKCKYAQLEQEMAARVNGCAAVLEIEGTTPHLTSPDSRQIPLEHTCVFTSTGPAGMLCELRDGEAWRAEVRETTFSRLQQELHKAQLDLKLRDEEVSKLSQIRDEVGAELEELTASLFEEANNMVRDANVKQAYAEKLLKEANLKMEVLQAEVQALKTLVITSTPSAPNPHLHPQIESKRSLFGPGHRRSPSNYELASVPPTEPLNKIATNAPPEDCEVDPVFHQEFIEWHENPILSRTSPFLEKIYQQDIIPCLDFANRDLSTSVLTAIENNVITIELVNGKNPFPKRCSLLDASRVCRYRLRLGEDPEWHAISRLCRNRVAAVCDFFCYIRYIKQGLVKSAVQEVYWEVVRRRRDINLARLGLLAL